MIDILQIIITDPLKYGYMDDLCGKSFSFHLIILIWQVMGYSF